MESITKHLLVTSPVSFYTGHEPNVFPSSIIKGSNCKTFKLVAIVILFPSHVVLIIIKDKMTFYLCP